MKHLLVLVLFSLFVHINANGIRGGSERVWLFNVYRLQQTARSRGLGPAPANLIAPGCVGTAENPPNSCDFDEFLKHINRLNQKPNLVGRLSDGKANLFPELALTARRVNNGRFATSYTNFGSIVSGATGYTSMIKLGGSAFAQTRSLFASEANISSRINAAIAAIDDAVGYRQADYHRKLVSEMGRWDYKIVIRQDLIPQATHSYNKFNLERTLQDTPGDKAELRRRITGWEANYKVNVPEAAQHHAAIQSVETARARMGAICPV